MADNMPIYRVRLTRVATIVVVALAAANFLVSNILATSGETLHSLERRKGNILDQNEKIRQEVIRMSSLQVIAARAKELGFKDAVYVKVGDGQALVAMGNKEDLSGSESQP